MELGFFLDKLMLYDGNRDFYISIQSFSLIPIQKYILNMPNFIKELIILRD